MAGPAIVGPRDAQTLLLSCATGVLAVVSGAVTGSITVAAIVASLSIAALNGLVGVGDAQGAPLPTVVFAPGQNYQAQAV